METRTPDLGTLLHAGTRPRPGLPTRVPEPDNGRGFPTAQPADGSKYISTWYSRPTVAFTLGAVTGALKCSPKTLPCMLKQAAIALRYGYTNKFVLVCIHTSCYSSSPPNFPAARARERCTCLHERAGPLSGGTAEHPAQDRA